MFLGFEAQEAEDKLKEQHPDFKIQRVPEGSMVTQDYRPDRIRIFYNSEGKVAKTPRIG